ncbi:MAG: choice-of-anchor B family protein, partial [Bacteroidota bacterium]
MRRFLILTLFIGTLISYGQTPCENGMAGNYECLGLNLQGHISAQDLGAEEHNGIWVNDIWGWVDPDTGKEYAIVGMPNGTSFVDVSDPVNPVVLGVLLEHNSISSGEIQPLHDGAKSTWRDIKVYRNHAYIVSEDPNHGMQVFDLTNLRNVTNAPENFAESGHYAGIGKAHNIVINEETGFAFAVGFNANDERACSVGGLHIIDLSDPTNPTFAGCFDDDGYTHDAQCVVYRGPDADYAGKEICFNSNEDEVVIVDVDDKSNIQLISKRSYSGVQYTHQGWLTDDHKYFLSNDELDESNLNQNTRTFIWDVEDLDNPTLLGHYQHGNRSIDHNLYVHGKNVYESNYTSGLVILDTIGIAEGTLRPVAYFDTYRSSDGTFFDGSWSNYPYFPSGNIIVSDITNGLFILKMQSFFLIEQPSDYNACKGEHINIPISVEGENLTYQWQINEGNGFEDITNLERYKNTRTTSMHAHTLELSQHMNQYRCIVSNGTSEITTDAMTVFVTDSPRADFSYELVDTHGNVTFSNSSVNADSFAWRFSDGTKSSEDVLNHQFEEDGSYDIQLIAYNDCTSDTLSVTLDILILSASDATSDDLLVYPTIVKDRLHIQSNNGNQF